MLNKKQIAEFFATFFYIGKIKYCPGTFGSIAAFPLCCLVSYFVIRSDCILLIANFFNIQPENWTDSLLDIFQIIFYVNILSCIILFILGTYFSSLYVKYTNKEDPKEVVIDEVVGQLLTISLCSFSAGFVIYSKIIEYIEIEIIFLILVVILPFVLFRLFDIIKPWPINWLDKNIEGGIGIMLDDVAAAIFASVIHYAIIFSILEWLG